MPPPGIRKILAVAGALILVAAGYHFRAPIWDHLSAYYFLLEDREKIKGLITGFGAGAPLVFILLQISQVLLAPIPGEATGFIGGYLFGALKGFLYSTVGLTVGSWINFAIGRFFGERYVRRLIPVEKRRRLDQLLRHQGILAVFILFVIPGFPKDYLCLFLGLTSTLPMRVLLPLAAVGRIPGTLMLSLQGAFLSNRSYTLLAVMTGVCLGFIFLIYCCRDRIYRWIERINNKDTI